jgi:hypothetical protein
MKSQDFLKVEEGLPWWYTSIIPGSWEVEIKRIIVPS